MPPKGVDSSNDVIFDNPLLESRDEVDFDSESSSPHSAGATPRRNAVLFSDVEIRSLYCLDQSHLPRQLLISLVQRAEFDYCVLAVIVANAVLIREKEIGGSPGVIHEP